MTAHAEPELIDTQQLDIYLEAQGVELKKIWELRKDPVLGSRVRERKKLLKTCKKQVKELKRMQKRLVRQREVSLNDYVQASVEVRDTLVSLQENFYSIQYPFIAATQ